jgi:hypothetical protein
MSLVTFAHLQAELDAVLSAPPVERQLQPAPFKPVVLYEAGTVATIVRVNGIVRACLATEARIIAFDLDPQDAMSLSERLTAQEPPDFASGEF